MFRFCLTPKTTTEDNDMSASPAPDGVLKPTLSVFDVVAITVSAVTPASSVFVIAPFAIQQAGSGVFLAFVMAALLALMFAFCYAELGRAHNSAGGEYVYAKRVFGGMAGYATFLKVLVMLLFIPPVLATGAATYLNNALGTTFDAQTVALVIVVCSYALGILNIKLNAWITGTCLLLEVAALLVIVVIGFGNPVQPASVLLQPQIVENGVLHLAPWALVIGAPPLSEMISSPDPIGYLLTSHGNETLSRLVSAGIFLSVFNAIVAIVIQIGRVVFSSGRDALWTPGINKLFTRIHPRWDSPW